MAEFVNAILYNLRQLESKAITGGIGSKVKALQQIPGLGT